MEKMILFFAMLGAAFLLTGCHAGYVNNLGMSSPMPGGIYSDVRFTTYVGNKVEKTDNIEFLGDVSGEAKATNVLLIVAVGDTSIETAKINALKKMSQADDIVNIEIDTEYSSILSIVNTTKVIVRGKAIKYINQAEKK